MPKTPCSDARMPKAPCLVARMLKMRLTVDTLMVPQMADTPKVLGLMRVCLNPRGVTYLMQVLLEKRTMKVFRGEALTQVLMAHCLTQVQWGEALVQVLVAGKRTE